MDTLREDLDRVRGELAAARVEETRLAARIKGLEAQRDALLAAVRPPAAQPAVEARSLVSTTKDRAIVAVLTDAARPMRIKEIVHALHEAGRPGERYDGVSVYLNTLLGQGRVQRVSRGLYIADPGAEVRAAEDVRETGAPYPGAAGC